LRPRVRKIFSAVLRWWRFTRARRREEVSIAQICSKVSVLQDPEIRQGGRMRIRAKKSGNRNSESGKGSRRLCGETWPRRSAALQKIRERECEGEGGLVEDGKSQMGDGEPARISLSLGLS
jgi:hypothetical protein